MAIDYSALLGLAAGIQVAKGDYDFARDGGAQYASNCKSAIIPAGSIILGALHYATIGFTYAATGYHHWQVMGADVAVQVKTLGQATFTFINAAAAIVTDVDRKIDCYISDSACTAGAGTIWVFYLPT